MADSSYFRDKAEQATRLARDATDPVLQTSLTELALEYTARAAAIDGLLGIDSDDDKWGSDVQEPWTDKEDYLLITMKAAGKSVPLIAKELKRTQESVVSRTGTLKRRAE